MIKFINYLIPRFLLVILINLPVCLVLGELGIKWQINYILVGYITGEVACIIMNKIEGKNV